MTEWREVGLVLLGLYTLEGAFLLSAGAVVFVQWWSGVRIELPSAGGRRDFPRFGPFVPWGRRWLATEWPCSLSPTGIQPGSLAGCSEALSTSCLGDSLRFEDIESMRVEASTLVVNGSHFARFVTSGEARRFASHLQQLRGAPLAARKALIHTWVASRLDAEAVQRRVADFTRLARPLAMVCTAQGFVLGAVIANMLFDPDLLLRTWKVALCLWVLLLVPHTALFLRCHRRFRPEYRAERIQALVTNLLAPVASVFAHVHLSEKIVEEFEPIAVAMAVASPREVRALARLALGAQRSSPAGAGTAVWFAHTVHTRLREVLSRREDGLGESLATPPSRHPGARAYCPRCHDQFVVASGDCPRCEPLQLVAFSEPVVS
ncbi:MAG TPA: hypothetical protein VFE28_03825 [Candidatus Krumholzibacteria bacterium]|nr:hypothetical protein [Candidatus Krumholzibacteria bacterium]